jgi:hypothetical protein
VQIDLNLAFALRVLRKLRSDESEALLAQIYKRDVDHFVKRDIMLIMAAWGCNYWVSHQKTYFGQMHQWVRRAFLVASFILGDEGAHWRKYNRDGLTQFEQLIRDWAAGRKNAGGTWEIPI